MNTPHGGKLINRILKEKERQLAIKDAASMPTIEVHRDTILDIANIATGAFSPLQGFVLQHDFLSIIHDKKLENGTPWTIPITFPLKAIPRDIKEGQDIALYDEDHTLIAILHLEQIYTINLHEATKEIFGTSDRQHPGVNKMYEMGNKMLGGEVDMINMPKPIVEGLEYTPEQTRAMFEKFEWKTVVGFQTRNVPHRAHEFLQKAALELTDGILLHPLIGWKKKGDYKPQSIMNGYATLIQHYYPKNRAFLAALTTQMRYAGPREAVFHAIIRKNYGCTHFIVGRDHAGVGGYYKTYEAHEIFDDIPDLGIEIIKMKGPYFCKHCNHIATEKTCPHAEGMKIQISGTEIRDMLRKGKIPPKEFMREEVAKQLTGEDVM